MAKERDKKERKKEKEEKEKKEKKRREADELEVREKKISKKHKSDSKKADKSERSKKKSKKSDVEEKSPKKSKESKKKHKKSDEIEEPQTEIVRLDEAQPAPVTLATTNESDLDFEYDKEDIKQLLETYSKEELVSLIYKTAEKDSRLISTVLETADRDSTQRNLFVRGLGWDTTHENLKAAFEVYGEIEECSVVMDKDTGRAKGYGFVMFKTWKGAREALKNPEKRMYNRTVSCNLASAKPAGAGKARDMVEPVKIELSQLANQSEVALPGHDLAHGHMLDKGHPQQTMPMFAGQNMPFYGHSQPPGFNPMYGAMMGNQGALMGNQMVPGLPNYRIFGSGMMNQGSVVPPNHVGMAGQYVGDGPGPCPGGGNGFDERAWYMR